MCDFSSGYILHLWEHIAQRHPDQMPSFNPRSKDMVSALIAEQNLNILEEVETLKKDMKGSLAEFTEVMATCMETLRDGIIESTRSDVKRALFDPNAAAKLVNDDVERSISEKLRNLENIIEKLEKDKVGESDPKSKGKEK